MKSAPTAGNPVGDNLNALIRHIGRRTPDTGDFGTAIASLELFRRNETAPPYSCMVPPSIVLVVEGAKRMWIGGDAYDYDPSRFLVTSLDLPANSEVIKASHDRPCLGLAFKLDQRILAELIASGTLPPRRDRAATAGVGIGTVTDAILGPFFRLVSLLDEPEAIPTLAPLVQREIHYRLLMSDQSDRLRQIAAVDGHGYRIAKAIDWLKLNFASPLRVDDLASRVQMSTPSFHHHFRQLASMSPLQYQKWLRLNEARRLMLNEHRDVSTAAFEVGYESPSQFSREYARMFGVAPKRDITALRENAAKPSG
ncbi:AraC family transcriptional regulator [Pseudomonas nitroreducens]|uniref:AraC family transcriptional regulator n=1 Tax=Pseudomonas TaxID=286 RepID=UPI0007EE729F|nr:MULTISPECIES: AraC family transcriptional regulator [Pseudomonas]MCJ1882658.1 AraC family transcriptional regulator [Pseudomonas nitroreducens]MCJ1895300.1 AraC family transcriptional regulator [Pseudomonas nitroreducens]MDG9856859.1 AraC family transcriptional regulator [Pseudomonas nitroreducens]MDH1072861.1 AraC family transcriptional regulator [Pseudomonas nitroreducens]NMZ72256.1 AraC family transcriptional regulator [Pseudomonas nitroreducens]